MDGLVSEIPLAHIGETVIASFYLGWNGALKLDVIMGWLSIVVPQSMDGLLDTNVPNPYA